MSEPSTKPYLLRAIYEWCADNGLTPYIAVAVDHNTIVPSEHVRAGEIVLNISAAATNRLAMGNELIEFQARFAGVARELSIPVANVSAIYARENGHGMAFDVPKPPAVADEADLDQEDVQAVPDAETADGDEPVTEAASRPRRRRPKLKAVSTTQSEAGSEPMDDGQGSGSEASPTDVVAADADPGEPPAPEAPEPAKRPSESDDEPTDPDDAPPRRRGRPRLTRVK